LRVVAHREAVRLARHDRRTAVLNPEAGEGVATADPSREVRDALALLAGLPVRKPTVLTLQVSWHTYAEIAARLDMTERTVQRSGKRTRNWWLDHPAWGRTGHTGGGEGSGRWR
jgi:DNA-directed RNA polymerase specialized sigma24 family protein